MNTTMKHTSGPWYMDQYGHVYGWSEPVKIAHGTEQKTTVLVDSRFSNATTADKLLIAAAPDLLAAAKAFVEAWDKCLQLEKTDVALRLARAAIAKAEGTPPC